MMKSIQKTLSVGPLQCNCQILVCAKTLQTVIVDPGAEPEKIIQSLKEIEKDLGQSLNVKALFHTHAHFDHIGGTKKVKQHFERLGVNAPHIYLHPDDLEIYNHLKMQGQMFGIKTEDPIPVDTFFEDEQEIKFGELKFTVLHTPGHSPGGVCFRMHEDTAQGVSETVFTGDTLFKNSIGRSDLWGGSEEVLLSSIRERLLTLDGDTKVWPGHGLATRIGDERHV